MKFKRNKDQSLDISDLLRRGKIIKGSREWEELGRKRKRGGKRGKNQVWEEMEEKYRGS